MLDMGRAVGASKREVKVDALILATAEVVGCTALYTLDPWFDKIAKREKLRVQIRSLPTIRPRQVEIPDLPQVPHDPSKRSKRE